MPTADFTRHYLEQLRHKLLDLSGRNSLISFRHSTRSRKQLRLIGINIDLFLQQMEDRKSMALGYLPLPETEPEDEQTPDFLDALDQLKREDKWYEEELVRLGPNPPAKPLQKIENTLRDKLRQQLSMPFITREGIVSREKHAESIGINPSFDLSNIKIVKTKGKSSLQTLLYPEELERTASSIHEQAKLSEDESGINTLYCAIGFLEWYESDDSSKPIYSPILLYPLQISKELRHGHYTYEVSSRDEDLKENICLKERLKQNFAIQLPELKEDESIVDYFERVSKFADTLKKSWKIHTNLTIGFFSFAKLVMYHDLSPDNYSSFPQSNPADILINGNDSPESGFAEEYDIDSASIQQKIKTLIADADSSQLSAVIDAIDRKNMVIEGPPGTGKSQTITNIIAAMLAEGKTVLFVAEKRAALEVVKKRLDEAGLGLFCLELHSNKTRKTEILESLKKRLDMPKYAFSKQICINNFYSEHKQIKQSLREYLVNLHQIIGSTGKTLRTCIWRYLELKEKLQESLSEAIERLTLPNQETVTEQDFDRKIFILNMLEKHAKEHFDKYPIISDHPWQGLAHESLTEDDRNALLRHIEEAYIISSKLKELLESSSNIATGISDMTLGDITDLTNETEHIEELLQIKLNPEIIPLLVTPTATQLLTKLIGNMNRKNTIDSALTSIGILPEMVARHETLSTISAAEKICSSLGVDSISSNDLPGIIAKEENALNLWDKLQEFSAILGQHVGLVGTISGEYSCAQVYKLFIAADLIRQFEINLLQYRNKQILADFNKKIIIDAKTEINRLNKQMGELCITFNLDLKPNVEELRTTSTTLKQSAIFSVFNPRYWHARKIYFTMANQNIKTEPRIMGEQLALLANFHEALFVLEHNEHFKKILGPTYAGLGTPIDAIFLVNEWAHNVTTKLPAVDTTAMHLQRFLFCEPLEKLQITKEMASHPQLNTFLAILEKVKDDDRNSIFDKRSLIAEKVLKLKELHKLIASMNFQIALDTSELKNILEQLQGLKQLNEKMAVDKETHLLLGIHYPSSHTDTALIAASLEFKNKLLAIFPDNICTQLLSENYVRKLKELNFCLLNIHETLSIFKGIIAQLATVTPTISVEQFYNYKIPDIVYLLNRAKTHKLELAQFVQYLQTEASVKEEGLAPILDVFLTERKPLDNLASIYEYCFCRNIIKYAAKGNPLLRKNISIELDLKRHKFRELDNKLIGLYRQKLAAILLQSPIEEGSCNGKASDYTNLYLLKHEISKQRKHLPIRHLMSRAGTAIQQLKPCFMMSPLSVSQFLESGRMQFDVVIMDEASQLRPEDAMGAVLRGSQLIVVGDPKQLPPTNFFNFGTDDLQAEEEETIASDHESILDLAMRTFKARRLKWHYRSRHESLIAFSNAEFYDGSLIIFPSPTRNTELYGIKFHRIEGVYEKHRNLTEAKQLVEDFVKFVSTDTNSSIGIAAINQQQRDLIDDLIAKERKTNPCIEKYFTKWDSTLEPLFIKNLENVQGDERDIMFISTVYGKDSVGNFYQRFGPINGSMGHRRLNVLFTRAKKQMRIFCSIDSDAISAGPSASPGLKAFKNFLHYARTSKLPAPEITSGDREPDSDFENFVIRYLKDKGYEVTPQLGVAGYFIDIAVKHPSKSDTYVLGVECDGATYHSAKAARDRDKIRQCILENLNWKIHRIWSTDWFQNPDQEKKRLLSALPPVI